MPVEIGPIIIVGAGHAGVQAAASLRELGFSGRLQVVNGEGGMPYQRPPLSKTYIAQNLDDAAVLLRPQKFFDDKAIELLDERVIAINRATHSVRLSHSGETEYAHLIIATGAANRDWELADTCIAGVHSLRTRSDADRLKLALVDVGKVIIVGAGFIGLELAATLSKTRHVRVFEAAERALARAVSAEMSTCIQASLTSRGIAFHFGEKIQALEERGGTVSGVVTSSGRRFDADLLVYGIGAVPRVALAEASGLAVENGIVVDGQLTTSDPLISAIGDVATFPFHRTGQRIRIESIQNANDQARFVAAKLMGRESVYKQEPWFWSDQGDMKLQIVGLAAAGDPCVDVRAEGGKAVVRFSAGRMAALETINLPGIHLAARKALGQERHLAMEQAIMADFDFSAWLRGT